MSRHRRVGDRGRGCWCVGHASDANGTIFRDGIRGFAILIQIAIPCARFGIVDISRVYYRFGPETDRRCCEGSR